LAQHLKVDYTKLGEQEGYVTVYPSGVNGWNIGSHDAYSVKRRTSDADDIGFFRAMFDTLIAEGVADAKRIYITGGSNGGVMTQFLVCHLADRIAGAGVVVATLPRAAEKDWPKPARPVPILIMLGTVDPMKPWNGNKDQMSADETIAFWRKQNGCTGDAKRWDLPDRDPNDGARVYAQRWEGQAPVHHGRPWPRLAHAAWPRRNWHRPQNLRHFRSGGALEVLPVGDPTHVSPTKGLTMKAVKLTVSAIAIAAFFTTLLVAQQGGGLAVRFKQLDRNGDGKLSAEEFPGPLFKQMDKDGDGSVTRAAARQYYSSRTARQSFHFQNAFRCSAARFFILASVAAFSFLPARLVRSFGSD